MASPGEKYPRSLRGRMPRVAAFVDALRAAGWADDVDAALRNAKAGGTDFWASEGGSEFGARPAAAVESFSADRLLAASVVKAGQNKANKEGTKP